MALTERRNWDGWLDQRGAAAVCIHNRTFGAASYFIGYESSHRRCESSTGFGRAPAAFDVIVPSGSIATFRQANTNGRTLFCGQPLLERRRKAITLLIQICCDLMAFMWIDARIS